MEKSLTSPNPDERGELETDPLGVYEGERNENGERHGDGKTLLPNGDMYVGQYCNGLRHGKGIYVFKNGARYNGDWRDGQKYGQGIFWYPDGTQYEGEWKRDAKHGFGAYHYATNDVYEGSWKEDLRHGMGTYLYADTGTKFMGTWMEDRMEGPGQLIHARCRFHGFWKLNLENDDDKSQLKKGRSPRIGVRPMWRARCITPYNPELLPPEARPLREEVIKIIITIVTFIFDNSASFQVSHHTCRRSSDLF
ncbi:radial spoke head 1 homolog isoform X1 [Temnothorax curvispinosus]|uniref:Radial spoke head 1 homolog isoform X1 n=1 Tax=Temnothorax curvispinosus TaxID=300111 RepID=A0A6J1PJE0_9HYME|nr:radial spoke head 1 homolog isoform X1 [Temnothorax curvispinosus]